MKNLLLASVVVFASACTTPQYQPPPDSSNIANIQFDGLDYRTPLDAIEVIDRQTCKALERVIPMKTVEGLSSTVFVVGQPISLKVAFHGRHRSAWERSVLVRRQLYIHTRGWQTVSRAGEGAAVILDVDR